MLHNTDVISLVFCGGSLNFCYGVVLILVLRGNRSPEDWSSRDPIIMEETLIPKCLPLVSLFSFLLALWLDLSPLWRTPVMTDESNSKLLESERSRVNWKSDRNLNTIICLGTPSARSPEVRYSLEIKEQINLRVPEPLSHPQVKLQIRRRGSVIYCLRDYLVRWIDKQLREISVPKPILGSMTQVKTLRCIFYKYSDYGNILSILEENTCIFNNKKWNLEKWFDHSITSHSHNY